MEIAANLFADHNQLRYSIIMYGDYSEAKTATRSTKMMTEATAKSRGMEKTGAYGRHTADPSILRVLARIKAAGCKGYVVSIPDSPQCRGPIGVGYGVVAEPRFALLERRAELERNVAAKPEALRVLLARHAQELADFEATRLTTASMLANVNAKLNA
jgi:hypothetical protein